MADKKLTRSLENKKLCGVCSGLARYFNLDVTILRIILILVGLCTAVLPSLLIYFILALIMPVEN